MDGLGKLRIVIQVVLLILTLFSAIFLLMGVWKKCDIRRSPLGGFLLSLPALTLLHAGFFLIWWIEVENQNAAKGEICRLLVTMTYWLDVVFAVLMLFLSVCVSVAAFSPNHYEKKTVKNVLWGLLAFTWVVPLLWALIFNYGLGEVVAHYDFCAVAYHRDIDMVLHYVDAIAVFFLMLIMSIALIVLNCLLRARQPGVFEKHALLSACISAVFFTIAELIGMLSRDFPVLAYPELFLFAARPSLLCLIWLLTCRDIRRAAFCKPPPSDEEVELIQEK